MKIKVLCARVVGDEAYWVSDAVDEWTVDDVGLPPEVEKKLEANPAWRLATITVPDDFFERVFAEVEVEGKLEDDER